MQKKRKRKGEQGYNAKLYSKYMKKIQCRVSELLVPNCPIQTS